MMTPSWALLGLVALALVGAVVAGIIALAASSRRNR